jgi:phosphate starvation-inducible PhoH-like protein
MTRKKQHDSVPSGPQRKILKPMTRNQAEYIRDISENDIVFCTGPAGTGKTAIAVGMACEYFLANRVSKIIVTRPIIESGRGIGFLPGSAIEKVHPYMIPVIEEMEDYLGKEMLARLRATDIVQVCPIEYMRGRNFHDSFVILDESQNCTIKQIKLFITRMGRDSKVVLNGDVDQVDLPEYSKDSFRRCMDAAEGLEGIGVSRLTYDDIVRNATYGALLQKLNKLGD